MMLCNLYKNKRNEWEDYIDLRKGITQCLKQNDLWYGEESLNVDKVVFMIIDDDKKNTKYNIKHALSESITYNNIGIKFIYL